MCFPFFFSWLIHKVVLGQGIDRYLQEMDEQHKISDEEPSLAKLKGRSLCLFSPTNPIRIKFHQFISTAVFKTGIMLLILLSSVCLAVDTPFLDPFTATAKLLMVLEYIFIVLFFLEMMLKIIAVGFGE